MGVPFSFRTRPLRITPGVSPGSSRLDRRGAPSRKNGPSISCGVCCSSPGPGGGVSRTPGVLDRKSTRLNSSHVEISYAVFCLKKKKQPRLRCEGLREGGEALRRAAGVHYPLFFFFNDTATTEIYTLSLHDALPI